MKITLCMHPKRLALPKGAPISLQKNNSVGYYLKGSPKSCLKIPGKNLRFYPSLFLACFHLRPFEITPFEDQNMHENSRHTRFITPHDRCNSLTPFHYLHERAALKPPLASQVLTLLASTHKKGVNWYFF